MNLLKRALILAIGIYLLATGVEAYGHHSRDMMIQIANHFYRLRPGRFIPNEGCSGAISRPPALYEGTVRLTECEERARRLTESGHEVGGFNYFPNKSLCQIYDQSAFRSNCMNLVRNGEGDGPGLYANAYQVQTVDSDGLRFDDKFQYNY